MKKLTTRINSAIAIGAFAMMALLSGCEYDYVEPDNTPPPDTISFANDILPIFSAGTPACDASGCHASGAFAPDLTPANAYNNLMQDNRIDTANPAASPFYIKISTGSMKTFLSTNDAKLILAWIEKGALNN
ncbi:MAG: hypothetical protein IPN08_13555 [Bacteroidales bacterium]|nr:hypothetical protein [Bacteroidales bacterium]MBK9358394.1 hypothetical protein [Bacteroidales bacterium]